MQKKIIILMFLLLVSSLSFSFAETYGDFNYLEYDTWVMIVYYTGESKSVVFPTMINGKPVEEIRGMNDLGLTSITLPQTLKRIGDGSFKNNNLTTVEIPNSVEEIGIIAFENNKLVSIKFNEGIQSISWGAFRFNQITTVSLPSSLKDLHQFAFEGNEIKTISLPWVGYIFEESFRLGDYTNFVYQLYNSVSNFDGIKTFETSNGIDWKVAVGGSYTVYKDNIPIQFEDIQPKLDGRLVPLRGFSLSIGFEIFWDQVTKQGVIRKNDGGVLKEIIFTKNSSTVKVNGKDYVMSVPATITQGRFMIPARDLVMAFATVEYKDVVISPTSVKGEFYDSDFYPKPDGLDAKWEDIPTITEYQERDLVPLSKGIEEILAFNYDDESRQIIQDANGQVPVVLNVEPLMIVIAVPSKMPVHKLRDGSYATLSGGLSIQNLAPARIKIGNVRFECSEGWQLLDIETQKTEIIGGKVGNKKYGAAVGFGSIQKMAKVLPVIKRPDIDVSEWDMMNSFDSLAIFYRFEFAGSATPRSLIPSKMIIEFEFDSVD